ncbi:hypothetical protein [Vibrio hyugaensis]|uniref:hypothetical protein n=1 Tax=Vibrio hyugaensis TaxID=1534743 RepID=UPI001FD0BE67|nr:hypothetical protein [Vibrio hyugaensis]
MVNVKRIILRVLVIAVFALSVPWFFSLGTYFSGFAHFTDEDHEILLNAKSGYYKSIHSFEGTVYLVRYGLYISFGHSMYFISLTDSYMEGQDPKFAERVIKRDLHRYFGGWTHLALREQYNGQLYGIIDEVGGEEVLDGVVLNGRLVGW